MARIAKTAAAPVADAPGSEIAYLSPEVRAEQALRFDQTRAHLDALAGKFTTIVRVDTDDNLAAARAAHAELRGARVKLEKTGKEAREDATKYGKAVIAVERKLVDIISPEENRIAGLISAEQRRRDDIERAAREAAEARARKIEAAFARVRQLPDLAQRATTDEAIAALQAEAQALFDDHSHLPAEFHAAAKYEARVAINGCKAAQDALTKHRADMAELEELRALRARQEESARANAAEAARAAAVIAEESKPAPAAPADDDDDDLPPLAAPARYHTGGAVGQPGLRHGEVAARVSYASLGIPASVQVPVSRVLPLLQAAKSALQVMRANGLAGNPAFEDLAAAIDEADSPAVPR